MVAAKWEQQTFGPICQAAFIIKCAWEKNWRVCVCVSGMKIQSYLSSHIIWLRVNWWGRTPEFTEYWKSADQNTEVHFFFYCRHGFNLKIQQSINAALTYTSKCHFHVQLCCLQRSNRVQYHRKGSVYVCVFWVFFRVFGGSQVRCGQMAQRPTSSAIHLWLCSAVKASIDYILNRFRVILLSVWTVLSSSGMRKTLKLKLKSPQP